MVAAVVGAVAVAVAVVVCMEPPPLRARAGVGGAVTVGVIPAVRGLARGARSGTHWLRIHLSPRAVATRRRRQAIDVVADLGRELDAGQPPSVALPRAVASTRSGVCPRTVALCGLGGDVADGLRRDAQAGGLPVLAALAALWRISEGAGAGMAQAAQVIADSYRADEQLRRDLATQLAGPRASARILALLPLAGLLMGGLLGAEPIAWLTGTTWGWLCLAIGAAGEVLGWLWVRRLFVAIERQL